MLRWIARGGCGIVFGSAMIGVGWVASASAQDAAPQRPLFPEGQCSGILCSTIGGAQAPQRQRSLFPEGQCGGVLCSAIGGSQAPPPPPYPPPPCGGGILCSMDPYGSGVPMTAAEVARSKAEYERQQAETQTAPPKAPVRSGTKRHARKSKPNVEAAAK